EQGTGRRGHADHVTNEEGPAGRRSAALCRSAAAEIAIGRRRGAVNLDARRCKAQTLLQRSRRFLCTPENLILRRTRRKICLIPQCQMFRGVPAQHDSNASAPRVLPRRRLRFIPSEQSAQAFLYRIIGLLAHVWPEFLFQLPRQLFSLLIQRSADAFL